LPESSALYPKNVKLSETGGAVAPHTLGLYTYGDKELEKAASRLPSY